MRIRLTALTLPDGHTVNLDPPVEFDAGEPIPLLLSMGKRPVLSLKRIAWYEFDETEEKEEAMSHSEYILTDEEIDQQEYERRQMEEQIAKPGASQPMTHAEKLLWLAKQEADCNEAVRLCPHDLEPNGVCSCTGHERHRACGGAGKVWRFPLLRQECPCQNIYVGNMEPSPCLPCREKANRYNVDSDHTMAGHSVFCAIDCECCQGHGWVPVGSLEAIARSAYETMRSHTNAKVFGEYIAACARGDKEGAVAAWYEAVRSELHVEV